MEFTEEQEQFNKERRENYAVTSNEDKEQLNAKQREHRIKKQHKYTGIARHRITDESTVQHVDIGRMDVECTHCGAMHWRKELQVY